MVSAVRTQLRTNRLSKSYNDDNIAKTVMIFKALHRFTFARFQCQRLNAIIGIAPIGMLEIRSKPGPPRIIDGLTSGNAIVLRMAPQN